MTALRHGPWLHLGTWSMTTLRHGPWIHLGTWTSDCTSRDEPWLHLGTWTMATLEDMDHDYTWGHGPWRHLEIWTMTTLGDTVTTLGDMDRGTTWGMDHDHTWGHGLGAWLHLIWAVREDIFQQRSFAKWNHQSLTLWVWQHHKFRTRLPKWALPCFATAGNWMAQHIFISNTHSSQFFLWTKTTSITKNKNKKQTKVI